MATVPAYRCDIRPGLASMLDHRDAAGTEHTAGFLSTGLDATIRALQLAGLIVIALAAMSIWSFWRLWRLQPPWLYRLGNGAIAAALLGLVWVGLTGGLLGFNLNY